MFVCVEGWYIIGKGERVGWYHYDNESSQGCELCLFLYVSSRDN